MAERMNSGEKRSDAFPLCWAAAMRPSFLAGETPAVGPFASNPHQAMSRITRGLAIAKSKYAPAYPDRSSGERATPSVALANSRARTVRNRPSLFSKYW